MKISRWGIAVCVAAASWILITMPVFRRNGAPSSYQNPREIKISPEHRARMLEDLLNQITGGPDYENGNFSFTYPTRKCDRIPLPGECCPHIQESLIKNITTTRPVPSKLLIGIGTLKSGTHFLNMLLQQHPQVNPGLRKEFQYFYEYETYKNGKEGFLELLGVNDSVSADDLEKKVFFELTPGTLKIPWAPCYLKSWFPHAKFLVIMRNPSMRVLSQLRYKRSRCIERAREGEFSISTCCEYFRNPIKWLGKLFFSLWRNGCAFNEGKEGGNWKDCIYKLWGEEAIDAGSSSLIIQGLYGPQVAWWMEFFPPSQFIFIKAEDLFKDPVGEMNKILDVFDVYPKFGPEGIPLDHSESQQHKTNVTNVYEPLLDLFMEGLERFHRRPNKELAMLLEKQGIHRDQFDSSEVKYKNGEIPKEEFFRSMGMLCPERYYSP